MPVAADRLPLRSFITLLRCGLGLGLTIACLWYLQRSGLLRTHLPQSLTLPGDADGAVMPVAIAAMLAAAWLFARAQGTVRLSRVHDLALAAQALPLLGMVPGMAELPPATGLVTGTLAAAGAALLFHGWGVRLASLSGLDTAFAFALATFVAESVLAFSLSGLGGQGAWLALAVALPLGSRLLLGSVTLLPPAQGAEKAPLRPLPPPLLATLFFASAACGLFYTLLEHLPPESDGTVMASSAVFCGVALCSALVLRAYPAVTPRHLFRLGLTLLGIGFATLMLLGQRMPRVPMFVQLAGSAMLDIFMYTCMLHSAGLHASRSRARLVALYWALIFAAQWGGNLLSQGLELLLPSDIAQIQTASLAAVSAIISVILVVRPDPATYVGWRLPGDAADTPGVTDAPAPPDSPDSPNSPDSPDTWNVEDMPGMTGMADVKVGAGEPPRNIPVTHDGLAAPSACMPDRAAHHGPFPASTAEGRTQPLPCGEACTHPLNAGARALLPNDGAPALLPVGTDGANLHTTSPLTLNPANVVDELPRLAPQCACQTGQRGDLHPADPAQPHATPPPYPSAPPAQCLADHLRRMGLTRQQVTITLLLAERLTGPEICDRLNISYNTLKTHVRNIYKLLGVCNQQELRNAVTRADPAGR